MKYRSSTTKLDTIKTKSNVKSDPTKDNSNTKSKSNAKSKSDVAKSKSEVAKSKSNTKYKSDTTKTEYITGSKHPLLFPSAKIKPLLKAFVGGEKADYEDEYTFHRVVATYLQTRYPDALWTTRPQAGDLSYSGSGGRHFQYKGVKPDYFDIEIDEANGGYFRMELELKKPYSKKKSTPEQRAHGKKMEERCNAFTLVSDNPRIVKYGIDWYMGLPPTPHPPKKEIWGTWHPIRVEPTVSNMLENRRMEEEPIDLED